MQALWIDAAEGSDLVNIRKDRIRTRRDWWNRSGLLDLLQSVLFRFASFVYSKPSGPPLIRQCFIVEAAFGRNLGATLVPNLMF